MYHCYTKQIRFDGKVLLFGEIRLRLVHDFELVLLSFVLLVRIDEPWSELGGILPTLETPLAAVRRHRWIARRRKVNARKTRAVRHC